MGTSCSPGMAVNALPRSCAFALSSTEWQQALTASPAQRNLHRMAPTLGNMGPLKMNGSIYKNGLTSRVSSEPEEQRKQQRKSRERWGRRTRWWKKKVLMGLKGNVETNRENERWCFFKSIWKSIVFWSSLCPQSQHNTTQSLEKISHKEAVKKPYGSRALPQIEVSKLENCLFPNWVQNHKLKKQFVRICWIQILSVWIKWVCLFL